ncbi:MAG: iron uptake porin [Microcystis aeruginosa G13-07]|nr:iron uptake porin [Microcystis aeruginosa G13-11]NCS07137.1 iron uptake porin [Microcystis aeruginosa G13-07]
MKILLPLTSVILGYNLLSLSPILAQIKLKPQLEKLYLSRPPALEEIYNIHQLRDVTPEDWAYEALANLVSEYRCISGFPDKIFRGNRVISRYEFAAALNTCLLKINRIIDNDNTVSSKHTLAIIKRLQEEFATELQAITAKVDNLEQRVAFTEDHQFSPTTILSGSARSPIL